MVAGNDFSGIATNLHIFRKCSVTAEHCPKMYRDEVLAPTARLYAATVGLASILINDNMRPRPL